MIQQVRPYPWEKKPWELERQHKERLEYVKWVQEQLGSADLFISLNFRQLRVDIKKEQMMQRTCGRFESASWGTVSDVESLLRAIDARTNHSLLGRKWARMWDQRPEWVAFIERNAANGGYPHAHLLVKLKGMHSDHYEEAFARATVHLVPYADMSAKNRDKIFKKIYDLQNVIHYCMKFMFKQDGSECAPCFSPTFGKKSDFDEQSEKVKSIQPGENKSDSLNRLRKRNASRWNKSDLHLQPKKEKRIQVENKPKYFLMKKGTACKDLLTERSDLRSQT